MNDLRITSFAVSGLEYLFIPPGLPLVTKSTEGPTTSILVRGGAGTGKTTLAVALAHAVAKQRDGVALYLTTEFVATEIPYKAAALHLPQNSVIPWSTPGEHAPGTIFARHLLQTRAGEDEQELQTVGERKLAAIEAVWESVAPTGDPTAARPPGPPIRAVVIDAFGLPDATGEDPHLRNELLTLVQALELAGMSVILVEEADSRARAWLSFVVDIVFEIDLSAGEDTGSMLLRRLKCPKSRYGQALPGPHDFGLDVSMRPAVWPDLAFSNSWASLRREDNRPPTFLAPQEDRFGLYGAGSVIISDWSNDRPFLHRFRSLPGIKPAEVQCGPLTQVRIEHDTIFVAEGQGVFALAWLLLDSYHGDRINAVELFDLGYFLSGATTRRSIRAIAILRAIVMLRAAGLSICIHGDVQALEATESIASCIQGDKHISDKVARRPPPRLARADRWLRQFGGASNDADGDSKTPFFAHINGQFMLAKGRAESLGVRELATYYMLVGNDLNAARLLRPGPRYPDELHMWSKLAAIHAGNTIALEQLATEPASLNADDTVSLLRALANHQQIERLQTVIEFCHSRWHLPSWYVSRLRAELLIDTPAHSSVARHTLEELATAEDVPPVHRAEIYYNLAVLDDQRDHEGARAARQRARELNPELDLETPP